MKNLGLNHVNLRVEKSSLDKMKDFYRDILNLSVGPRPNFGTVGYWLYSEGKPVIHLSVFRNGEPNIGCGGHLDHIAFDYSGGESIERTLQEKGVKYKKVDVPEEKFYQIFINDPVGTLIELTVH